MVKYEREILLVLKEAGPKGMPLRRIVLNVFNMTNTLFEHHSQQDIYDAVGAFLRTQSVIKGSSIEKADTRGWYRLNINSTMVRQLFIEFQIDEEDEWML